MIEPRPYQVEVIAAFMANLARGVRRQLLVLPTGTGKTLTALLLGREIGGPVLWLAHRDELIQQPHKAAGQAWPGVSRGIVKAARDEWDRDLVFASVQTASRERRLEKLSSRQWKLVVVDEGHHAPSASWRRVLSGLGCLADVEGTPLLGLTATPERLDSAKLDDIFDRVCYQYHLGQAVKDGYLAKPEIIFEPMKIDLSGVGTRAGDFNPKELDIALLEGGIVNSICKTIGENALNKKTLIFTVSVKQAHMVADALRSGGFRTAAIDGSMDIDERRYLLRKFATGEIQILSNCAVLTEGFDEPSIECIVMARPTQSKSLFIQCVGRGLRLSPGKDACTIIDMVAVSGRHSLVQAPVIFGAEVEEETSEKRDAVLLKTDPIEYWRQRLSTQVLGLESISRSDMRWIRGGSGELLLSVGTFGTVRIMEDRSGGWRVDVIGSRETGRDIDPLSDSPVDIELAQGIGEDYVRRCKSVVIARGGRWRDQPATEAQIGLLRKWKIKPPDGVTKGQASDMLTAAAAKGYEPATTKQIAYLKRLRVKFKEPLSKREAGRLIGAARS